MGNLSNLYISQSFISLIHLGSNNTASATLTELQDGLGNGIGVSVNTLGDITAVGNITASKMYAPEISASNLYVSGTIYAYEIRTTIESSSIIFSSGSNILGDAMNDTQTLIGRVIATGSLEVTGSTKIIGNTTITGSTTISGSITASGDISSSTLSGIGNVTLYSTSVDSRLDIVEATASLYLPFSTSVDSRLDLVEATASLYTPFSTSVDLRLDNLENFSSSLVVTFATVAQLNVSSSTLQSNINTKLDTSSFNTYSASAYQTDVTQSINITQASASAWGAFQSASSYSGSLATSISSSKAEYTSFSASAFTSYGKLIGNNTYSGSQIITGSLRGNVTPITIASNTASIDCSRGTFFTVSLPGSGANTRLEATNILPGETISLRVTCAATTSSVSYPTYIKFPKFSAYTASLVANAIDIVTFVTFDSTNLFAVNVKNMI